MTCIIGFTDRESSVSWIGCDSLGSNNYTKLIESPAKAFRNEQIRNVLMGGTTSFRHLDLLKYAEDLFDGIDVYRKPIIDHKYMVTKFVPKVINLFKSGVVGESETERWEILSLQSQGVYLKSRKITRFLSQSLDSAQLDAVRQSLWAALLRRRTYTSIR